MSSVTNLNDFAKGFDLIAIHSPLVLYWKSTNTTSSGATGDMWAVITGLSPADNLTAYTFDLIYIETIDVGAGNYDHYFRLNITKIINGVANSPRLDKEGTGYFQPSRLSTKIRVEINTADDTSIFEYWYMHGFNQVHDPDGSCLVEFATLAEDKKIPIAPGVPNLYFLWINASVNPGDFFAALEVSVDLLPMGTTIEKALYELLKTGWEDDIYTAASDVIEEIELSIFDDVDKLQTILLVPLKTACEGSIVLSWLNRYGTYSTMAFNKHYLTRIKGKPIGFSTVDIIDIADVQSRELSRGSKDVNEIITATAEHIPTEYFPIIEDLFYSMDVYMYTGVIPNNTFSTDDWIRVKVRGELPEKKKRNHASVTVEVMPPEKYTQTR